MNLYMAMITEWADEKALDRITEALRAPASWRDPDTGLPAGWGDEEDDWAEWESSVN